MLKRQNASFRWIFSKKIKYQWCASPQNTDSLDCTNLELCYLKLSQMKTIMQKKKSKLIQPFGQKRYTTHI